MLLFKGETESEWFLDKAQGETIDPGVLLAGLAPEMVWDLRKHSLSV